MKGVGAGALSVGTGVRMLIDAGCPIDDARRRSRGFRPELSMPPPNSLTPPVMTP